jgi:hypothetical protein
MCAEEVSSHVDRDWDFTRYRTFDWGLPTLCRPETRDWSDAFVQDHIQGAIERNLAARGFERAAATAIPDVRVHFHAVIDRRIAASELDARSGYCSRNDCQTGISEYEEGTLVVDMIDVQTNRLVWRGWARDSVEGVLDNRIGREDRRRRAADVHGCRRHDDAGPEPSPDGVDHAVHPVSQRLSLVAPCR